MKIISIYTAFIAAFILLFPSLSAGDEIGRIIEEAKKAKAPAEALDAIVQRAQNRGLSRDSIAPLLMVIRDASLQGLYLNPVLDKIQEGLSKNASPDAIERVARRVMARVSEAEESLESFLPSLSDRESVIETILEARDTGLSNADIREVLYATSSSVKEKSPDPGRVIAAIDGTAELVRVGVEGSRAALLTKEALSRGFSRNDMRGLNSELTHSLAYLTRREKDEVFYSTVNMIREGQDIESIKKSLRERTLLSEGGLGVGKGLSPSEGAKEGIGPGESEHEHDIPKPAPREKDRGK